MSDEPVTYPRRSPFVPWDITEGPVRPEVQYLLDNPIPADPTREIEDDWIGHESEDDWIDPAVDKANAERLAKRDAIMADIKRREDLRAGVVVRVDGMRTLWVITRELHDGRVGMVELGGQTLGDGTPTRRKLTSASRQSCVAVPLSELAGAL